MDLKYLAEEIRNLYNVTHEGDEIYYSVDVKDDTIYAEAICGIKITLDPIVMSGTISIGQASCYGVYAIYDDVQFDNIDQLLHEIAHPGRFATRTDT